MTFTGDCVLHLLSRARAIGQAHWDEPGSPACDTFTFSLKKMTWDVVYDTNAQGVAYVFLLPAIWYEVPQQRWLDVGMEMEWGFGTGRFFNSFVCTIFQESGG